MAPNEPPTESERRALLDRITVLAWELSERLRAAALFGMDMRVDLVDRTDPLNPGGLGYTQIQVQELETPTDEAYE